jgi:uncharacterized protein YdhG (YjbR/CyaY superfamily)
MISKHETVDAFLAELSDEERAVFTRVRALLKKANRDIAESMQYRMPTYLLRGEPFGAFNKQKNYLCVYLPPKAIDPFRKELKARSLDCGKSCIRLKKPADLPLDLIASIIDAGAKQPSEK